MKRNVIVFGLILGAVLAGNMVYMTGKMYNDTNFQSNDVVGYAAMIVIFSLTFFGIRNYRNKELNGTISFSQAFKTGALIALIGATIYVVTWLFYYYLFVPDFIDKYTACVLKDASRNGASMVELNEKREEMAQFKDMYKSPFFVVLITYAEVLPIGLVVVLISALILKRKTATTTGH